MVGRLLDGGSTGAEDRRTEQKLGSQRSGVGQGGEGGPGDMERGLWCCRKRKCHKGKRYEIKINVEFLCEPQIIWGC